MRKFIMILTLSVTCLAASGYATNLSPPECGDNCPAWPWWVVSN
jgi:hypothetical protein